MTLPARQSAPIRLASAVARIARNRIAYLVTNGLDPAQARREAVTTIGRAVGHEVSAIGSADMFILLGVAFVLALAILLGLKRAPYGEAAAPILTAVILAPRAPQPRG